MNLLVTGGAGFIGSSFITHMLLKYKDINIINLDKLTYAGRKDNLKDVENNPNHIFIQGDICDRVFVENLFEKYQIDGVVHFAAESHVDNSIKDPAVFIKTNIQGTFIVLDVARHFWMDYIGGFKPNFQHARFHHISTDEVYGSLGLDGYFTEKSPYAPNSPYSASKASSDMLVRSYFHTYGMNVVITNCSNNYGPRQNDEKLIPMIIRKALSLEVIPIYGDGQNVRDWLYVLDHCSAIDKVFFEGKSGETYLIGGNNEKKNIEIAQTICTILDKEKSIQDNIEGIRCYKELINFVQDRPGHDFRYAIKPEKIMNELNWKPKYTFEEGLRETIQKYL